MASWTDGAAYAPIERPDGFATPEVDPLEVAVPESAQTPGPMPIPSDFAASGPVRPLAEVSATPPPGRNPSAPFQVSGGLLTTASSMGHTGKRDPRMPYPSTASETAVDALPPPTGAPLHPPVGPLGTPAAQASPLAGMSPQDRSSQKTLVFLAIAMTVLGLTIPAGAALMLAVAGVITWRTTRLTGKAGYWCTGVGLLLLVFGGLVTPDVSAVLGRLASVTFLAWFGISAYRRTRP